jgi:hypothetical protein
VKPTIAVFASFIVCAVLAASVPAAHARSSTRQARLQACADKSAGDACTYTKKGQDVNGTCTTSHRGKLICTIAAAGTGAPGATAPSGDTGTTGGDTGATGGDNPPSP